MKRKHPPFSMEPARSGNLDFCSEAGAHALALRIKAAWAACGHDVRVVVTRVHGLTSSDNAGIWTVQMPEIVNGVPVKGIA